MFISAACFNWLAAIVFVFFSDRVLALLSLESSPAALLFLHLFFSVVFLFGIAYYRAATDLAGQAEVIKLGGATKLALVTGGGNGIGEAICKRFAEEGATVLVTAYNASKGGVRIFSKSAALHCAQEGYGIRVNSVHPGYVGTGMVVDGGYTAR